MMTPEQLRNAGEKLYGKHWRAKLAQILGISRVTLWRYGKSTPIPETVELSIEALLQRKKPRR